MPGGFAFCSRAPSPASIRSTWNGAADAGEGAAGRAAPAAYVLPSGAGGPRAITVAFGAPVAGVPAVFVEYYNVGIGEAVGGPPSRPTAVSPTISSGTLSPSVAAR